MIVSHSRKFVFLRVTKTGSTTAQILLRLGVHWDYERDHLSSAPGWDMAGVNLPPDPDPLSITWRHADLESLVDKGVLTEEQVYEYDVYAFIRSPYERFVSGYFHTNVRGDWGPAGLTAEQFLQRKKQYPGKPEYFTHQIVGRPQHLWFQYKGDYIVKPLCFDNYDEELRFLLDRCGGYQFPEIPLINRSKADYRGKGRSRKHTREWGAEAMLDPQIQKEIEEIYGDDFKVYTMARDDARLRHGEGNPNYCGLGPKPRNLSKDADTFMDYAQPEGRTAHYPFDKAV